MIPSNTSFITLKPIVLKQRSVDAKVYIDISINVLLKEETLVCHNFFDGQLLGVYKWDDIMFCARRIERVAKRLLLY